MTQVPNVALPGLLVILLVVIIWPIVQDGPGRKDAYRFGSSQFAFAYVP
jgi:hypothetical protein